MVDVTKFVESEWLTVDFVTNSPSKRAVILDAGEERELSGRKKLVIPVEIDGQRKNYVPNVMSMTNLARAWGKDTTAWVGRPLSVMITRLNNRDMVLGQPLPVYQQDKDKAQQQQPA